MSHFPSTEEIIQRLDVLGEFAALGVEFTGKTNPKGWHICHAIGETQRTPSAGVNSETGYYNDFKHGEKLSLFDFAVEAGRFPTWREARDYYAAKAGLDNRQMTNGKQVSRVQPNSKTPNNERPKKSPSHDTLEKAINAARFSAKGEAGDDCRETDRWQYPLVNGFPWWIVRFDGSKGKAYRPISQFGPNDYRLGDPRKTDLPLFQEDDIDSFPPDEPIYVTEGEKCAAAAKAFGLLAVSPSHGSQSPHKSNWTRLSGRDVVIWPDNDEPGQKYPKDVQVELAKLSMPPCPLRVLDPTRFCLPPKGDFVDFLKERKAALLSDEAIRRELKNARDAAAAIDLVSLRQTSNPPAAESNPSQDAWKKPILTQGATLADLKRAVSKLSWRWELWIPEGTLTCIASDPGLGKTRFLLDLARRIWKGEPWPDGTPQIIEPGRPTLWVCGDRQHSQIVDAADAFGIPEEAIILAAPPTDPQSVLDLDNPRDLASLESLINTHKPALVIVDTLGNVTGKNLGKAEEARDIFAPLMDIAGRTKTSIVAVTHLSAEGHALGRRIEASCRTLIKITEPDPVNDPGHLRIELAKTAWKKPPAIGAKATDSGFEFGEAPETILVPTASKSKRGRKPAPASQTTLCQKWLADYLKKSGPAKVQVIRDEAKAAGFESSGIIYAAKDRLGIDEYEVPEGPKGHKYKWWKLPDREPTEASRACARGGKEFLTKPNSRQDSENPGFLASKTMSENPTEFLTKGGGIPDKGEEFLTSPQSPNGGSTLDFDPEFRLATAEEPFDRCIGTVRLFPWVEEPTKARQPSKSQR